MVDPVFEPPVAVEALKDLSGDELLALLRSLARAYPDAARQIADELRSDAADGSTGDRGAEIEGA